MATHGSATAREETPHANQTRTATLINALNQQALSVLNDTSIDAESRAILRYALEANDPWFAKLVQQAEATEPVIDDLNQPQTAEGSKDGLYGNKIELLVDLICRPGDEPKTKASALLVLLSTLERSTESKALANSAKHFAFAHCGDVTFDNMVDAQIAAFEANLFGGSTPVS